MTCAFGSDVAGDPAQCTCTPDKNPGTVVYDGVSCASTPDVGGPTSTLAEFCCEEPGFPGPGAVCRCYDDNTDWFCYSSDATTCICSYLSPETVAGEQGIAAAYCNNQPGADKLPWYCYVDTVGRCVCKENDDDLPAGAVATTDCTNAPPSLTKPIGSCPSGTQSTFTCHPQANGAGGSGSGCDEATCGTTSCVDGFCCAFGCQDGTCQALNCTD